MFEIKVIRGYDEEVLDGILQTQSKAYADSAEWKQYPDAREYYGQALKNPNYASVVLLEKGEVVGHIMVIPHNECLEDSAFRAADPEFVSDSERYYFETVAITPEVSQTLSGGKQLFLMLVALFREVRARFGTNKYSMHARIKNGVSRFVRKKRNWKVTKIRRIEKWPYNGNEPSDYIEAEYLGDYENI